MIRVENLSKRYGERTAVDDASFEVNAGEIVGFLGANGAGKTTTMRVLTGYLMPTRGKAWVAGHDMTEHSLEGRRHIGYLPEIVPLYGDMTTQQFLAFAARLHGLDRKRTRARIDEVVDVCRISEYRNVLVAKLSKGYRQRVGLAQAIIHDPAVLILDEPTAGIDPIQVAETRKLITALGENRTILLSSHILPEVSAICQRVIIIHRGRIIAEDRIEGLSATMKRAARLRLKVEGPPEAVTAALGAIESVRAVRFAEPDHIVEFAADGQPHARITEVIFTSGWTLLEMESVRMDLEDIFLELTSGTAPPT